MVIINIVYFAASLLISLLCVYGAIRFSKRHNLYDTVDERKIHTGEISRLGGFGFIVPFIILGLASFLFAALKGRVNFEDCAIWGLFSSALIIYVSGTTDDLKNLKPFVKLGLQILAAVVGLAFFCVAFREYPCSILNFSLRSVLIMGASFIFILGCVNSYNLIDGSDLLCSSLSIYSVFTLGFLLKDYNIEYFTLTLILCGGILGFMFFNKPDAKIFMGDGGSQSLGAVISYLCLVLLAKSDSGILSHLICLNLVSIPCIDCIAAIWRRLRQHVGIFHADRFHMHHKLLAMGFNKLSIAILVTILQVLICASAIVSWLLKDRYYTVCIIIQCVVFVGIVVYFAILHYRSHAVSDVK